MENSQDLTQKGKQRTSRTSKLTLEAVLQILTQSLHDTIEAGVNIEVDPNGDTVTIRLHRVGYSPTGVLVPAETKTP